MSDTDTDDIPVSPAEKRGRGAPRGKRTPTPAQLETLAKARHRAAEIRKHRTIIELEAAIEEKKASMPELTRFEPEIILPPNIPVSNETQKSWPVPVPYPAGEPPPDLPNPCESIVTPNEMPKKRMTKIIIEQSESDSDEFESCDRVIFVKRKGREKKKQSEPEPDVPVKQADPYKNTPVTKFTSHVEPNYFSRRFY